MTMRNSTTWANGEARLYETTVGPSHDPYGRTSVAIRTKDRQFTLVSCALAGDWLIFDGEKVAFINCAAETPTMRAEYERTVMAYTGWPSCFWLDELWQKVDSARVKTNPNYYDYKYNDRIYGHV